MSLASRKRLYARTGKYSSRSAAGITPPSSVRSIMRKPDRPSARARASKSARAPEVTRGAHARDWTPSYWLNKPEARSTNLRVPGNPPAPDTYIRSAETRSSYRASPTCSARIRPSAALKNSASASLAVFSPQNRRGGQSQDNANEARHNNRQIASHGADSARANRACGYMACPCLHMPKNVVPSLGLSSADYELQPHA